MERSKKYARLLTIAGSDSGGCAGIQADLKTASACGCFASTAITSLTVQNTMGVRAVHIPPADIVAWQIEAVIEDIGVDAVKLGMLPSVEMVDAVAELLERYKVKNIVLDPVMVATSGDALIPSGAADAIIKRLMPMATLVTPNIPEAVYITRTRIDSEKDFGDAAKMFASLGARNILLKAGHLNNGKTLTDYLYTDLRNGGADIAKYTYDYIDTVNTHGTGCTLSSAVASYLALGYPLREAVALAEEYLHKALLCGADYSLGHGHGPVHHFYKFWE